jgi:hypothetical protein
MAEKNQPSPPAAQDAPTRKPREKPLPALHADRMRSTEYVRNIWQVTPEVGTEPEELLAPDYWSHNAHQLRQRDRIEAWAEDLSWYAEYLVLDVGRNWAKVHLCENTIQEFHAFEPRRANMILPGHTVAYKGLFAKWCAIRDKDGVILKDKCETEGEALSWLSEHAKSLAA